MTIITDDHCTGYSTPGHPERPERIAKTLEKLGGQTELPIRWGQPARVEDSVLLRAHTTEHLTRLEAPNDFDGDTPFLPNIADYARASAGAALEALKSARAGQSAFSLMRPPGHHATRNRAMGFCYLNNVAIAVLEALASGANRVAVYDFDVHHENAGNNCFNYPVAPQTPRAEYRRVLNTAFKHLQTFKPDMVAVSAGFDAYARDPLAQETLEVEDYHWLGRSFRELGVPVFSLLEGGYSHDLPELIFAYLNGLEGT